MSNTEQLKTIYETSVFKNILHLVDDVYFPLASQWKNIGVSVSGGADSALMAYLLCDLIDKNQLISLCILLPMLDVGKPDLGSVTTAWKFITG